MIRKKKLESPPDGSMILASGAYLPTDKGRSILVFGGTGSGKYFSYIEPNLMQCNNSFIISDPVGDIYRQYKKFLENRGYKVRCLNLEQMDKGNHYNPFHYIRDNENIVDLVNTLITNTTPWDWNTPKIEPFREKTETALLTALIAYLHKYGTYEQKNFSGVINMLRAIDKDEANGIGHSSTDALFDKVRAFEPESFMVKQYDKFRLDAGTDMRTILISCAIRLMAFDLPDIAEFTKTDDIGLESACREKTAIFIVTPPNDTSFNFIAAMMYAQLFDIIARHNDKPSIYTHLFIDGSQMMLVPNLWKRIEAAKERGATITLFVHVPEIMSAYYRDDWGHVSETYDVALLFSPREGSTRDWFQKHAEFVPQKEAKAEKKKLFSFFGQKKKTNSTDACLEDIRSLPEDECLVAIKGIPVKKVPKYAAKNHPSWFMVRNGK